MHIKPYYCGMYIINYVFYEKEITMTFLRVIEYGHNSINVKCRVGQRKKSGRCEAHVKTDGGTGGKEGMQLPLHLRHCNRIISSRPRCIRSNLVAVGSDKLSPTMWRILASDFRRTEMEIRIARTLESRGEKRDKMVRQG